MNRALSCYPSKQSRPIASADLWCGLLLMNSAGSSAAELGRHIGGLTTQTNIDDHAQNGGASMTSFKHHCKGQTHFIALKQGRLKDVLLRAWSSSSPHIRPSKGRLATSRGSVH